jgi:hypothetical protein
MIEFTLLVESLRGRAAALSLRASIEDDVYPFMMDVYDMGMVAETDPRCREEVHAVLAATVAHLEKEFAVIERFASDIKYRSMTGWTDELTQWEDLCTRRSAVAFFVELYAGTALAPSLSCLDEGGLDRLMRDLASCHTVYDPSAIPPHMPSRHWWWWLPGRPPAALIETDAS